MRLQGAYNDGCVDALLKYAGVKQNLRALSAAQRATNPTESVARIQKALNSVPESLEQLASSPARPMGLKHGPLAAVINPPIGLNSNNAVAFPYTGAGATALKGLLHKQVGRVDLSAPSGRLSLLKPAIERSLQSRTFDHERAFRDSASGSHTPPRDVTKLPVDPATTAWKGGLPVAQGPGKRSTEPMWVSGYPDVAAGYANAPSKRLRQYDTAAFPDTPWTKHLAVDTRAMTAEDVQAHKTYTKGNKDWANRPAYERVVSRADLANPTNSYRVLPPRSPVTLNADGKPARPPNYVVPEKIKGA